MRRLRKENINKPELSDKIFKDRWKEGVHTVDQGRFDQLAKHFKGGRYLDIGCFNSPKLGELAEVGTNEIHGLDHAPKVIEVMRKKFPKVKYHLGDCYHLPFENSYFDYVVAGEIIEHLEHLAKFIHEAFRVLVTGGMLAISTPYKEKEKGGQKFISKEHLWSFDEEDMNHLFKSRGTVEIEFNEDNLRIIIVYIRKHQYEPSYLF